MEPRPCRGVEGAIMDTGQGPAASPVTSPVGLSSGEGVLDSQDDLKDPLLPKEEALEVTLATGKEIDGLLSPESLTEHGTVGNGDCSVGSEDGAGASGDCFAVKPKIVVELEDQESREAGNSSDEDMDPLIMVDDTESQTSDLINFSTVSYDVMHHPGAAEDDDDDKSIATVSSLSCDIKMDSPLKRSQGSNSSSIVNLLDLSVKESSGVAVSSPGPMSADTVGSTTSSCLSSPSFRSMTMSSAIDESISEAFMSVLQISEDKGKTVGCDYQILSQEDFESEGVSTMDVGSAACGESVNVSLATGDCSPIVAHEGNSGAQIAALEEDSSGAQCESSDGACSITSPLLSDEATRTETEFVNVKISPQLSACFNDASEDSTSECDILQKIEDRPADAVIESPSEVCKDSQDMQEPIVIPPTEIQDTTEKTNKFEEDPEETSSLIGSLVSREKKSPDTSEKNITVLEKEITEDNSQCSRTPLPVDIAESKPEGSELEDNLNSNLLLTTKILENVLNLDESGMSNNGVQMALAPVENLDERYKRPTTLPDINSNKVTSEKPSGMNFSEFLGLFNSANLDSPSKTKLYDAAALDEAQQMASFLVDDILQMAILKAEEKLFASKSLIENRVEAVQAARILVDNVLREASAHLNSVDVSKTEISTSCDIKDSGYDLSPGSSITEGLQSQVAGNVLDSVPCPETSTCCQEEPPSDVQEKTSPDHLKVTLSTISSAFENVNLSEDCSSADSLIDVESTEELTRTPSTETGGADLPQSSLLATSEVGLRSEASLFVDGVLEEAVKKYEEKSSSDSSPMKLKSLALDSEFLQEEEELATPCGEMLTEHFMDFESGRNVSVFCSIPESGSEDHLMAYDRIAHTIGNREVDSDNGKSVSVFRIEEDVFYEIQRASTCTSVFESVEEEDEDMIDTTLPVEDRPEKNMHTSVSFPSYDKDKLGASDDPFSADCDAFEDAVGAFLTKERLAHSEIRHRKGKVPAAAEGASEQESVVTCRALVLRHPEYDISSSEEKRRMAEKWANGGESEVPDTPEMREKQKAIREALDSDDDVAVKLCRLALTEGGLINDALRREAWPRMLGLDPTLEVDAPSLEDLKSHPEYGQVVLDVNRSLKRFPPDIPKDRRETLQDKLTRLIMYVISKHPHLRYYQGYHDVAVTFLLVVGESIAFQIMERLSTEHLSDCMQPTMDRTSYLLHFIYPLLHRLHPTLADYLERSEVGTMFCLPWFLTWFGHSLDRYQDVVRLYDHFLASPPLAPLYVAAVLVAHRADEVLAVDCDMAAIHALLSHIPDSLPLEILLRDSTDLYLKFPPESIEREVEERFRNEQDMRVQEMQARERVQRQVALRRRRGRRQGSGSWQLAEFQDRIGGTMMVLNQWIPPWVVQQQRLSMRFLFASATFFVGFYVYSRGVDMLPYP